MALSAEELKGLYVGQQLFSVEKYGNNQNVTVTKIANKYFYTDRGRNGRYFIEGGVHDNGQYLPSSELFFDEATYKTEYDLNVLWGKYKNLTNGLYRRPAHITEDNINQLIEILTPVNNHKP